MLLVGHVMGDQLSALSDSHDVMSSHLCCIRAFSGVRDNGCSFFLALFTILLTSAFSLLTLHVHHERTLCAVVIDVVIDYQLAPYEWRFWRVIFLSPVIENPGRSPDRYHLRLLSNENALAFDLSTPRDKPWLTSL